MELEGRQKQFRILKKEGLGDLRARMYSKAVPLHAVEAFEGRGSVAPIHSRPRH
jgi:hypothetical protein